MTLARLVLIVCLAAGPAFAQSAEDPARNEAASRIYERVFPDQASLIEYVLPYVPNNDPRAREAAADVLRRLGPEWLRGAFVFALAGTYTLPELAAYERFLATPEGLAIWRKTSQFDRVFNQLLEERMKAIGAI